MFEYMSPGNIRFTQDSIGSEFRDGGSINDAIESIIKRQKSASDFPLITVVKKNGKYYSLDNRRLYVFRALHQKGLLNSVEVNIGSYISPDRFTTYNDGVSVRVRGRGYTYPHAIPATDTSYSSSTTSKYLSDNPPSSLEFEDSCIINIPEPQPLLSHRSPPPKKFHILEDSTSTSDDCLCQMLRAVFCGAVYLCCCCCCCCD